MAGISPNWHGLDDVLWNTKEIWCNKHDLSQAQNWLSSLSAWLFYLTVFLSVCCPQYLSIVLTVCLLFSLPACCFHFLSILSVCSHCLSFCLSSLSVCCPYCLPVVLTVCLLLFFVCKGWKVSRIAKLKLKPQHIFGGNLCHSNVQVNKCLTQCSAISASHPCDQLLSQSAPEKHHQEIKAHNYLCTPQEFLKTCVRHVW